MNNDKFTQKEYVDDFARSISYFKNDIPYKTEIFNFKNSNGSVIDKLIFYYKDNKIVKSEIVGYRHWFVKYDVLDGVIQSNGDIFYKHKDKTIIYKSAIK